MQFTLNTLFTVTVLKYTQYLGTGKQMSHFLP